MVVQYSELRPTSGWDLLASLRHPCKFQCVSRLGSVTARQSSSGRQSNFVALNRGRHLYLTERPSRWAFAHILVVTYLQFQIQICFLTTVGSCGPVKADGLLLAFTCIRDMSFFVLHGQLLSALQEARHHRHHIFIYSEKNNTYKIADTRKAAREAQYQSINQSAHWTGRLNQIIRLNNYRNRRNIRWDDDEWNSVCFSNNNQRLDIYLHNADGKIYISLRTDIARIC